MAGDIGNLKIPSNNYGTQVPKKKCKKKKKCKFAQKFSQLRMHGKIPIPTINVISYGLNDLS